MYLLEFIIANLRHIASCNFLFLLLFAAFWDARRLQGAIVKQPAGPLDYIPYFFIFL